MFGIYLQPYYYDRSYWVYFSKLCYINYYLNTDFNFGPDMKLYQTKLQLFLLYLRFQFHVGRRSKFPLSTNGRTQLFQKFTIKTMTNAVMHFSNLIIAFKIQIVYLACTQWPTHIISPLTWNIQVKKSSEKVVYCYKLSGKWLMNIELRVISRVPRRQVCTERCIQYNRHWPADNAPRRVATVTVARNCA